MIVNNWFMGILSPIEYLVIPCHQIADDKKSKSLRKYNGIDRTGYYGDCLRQAAGAACCSRWVSGSPPGMN